MQILELNHNKVPEYEPLSLLPGSIRNLCPEGHSAPRGREGFPEWQGLVVQSLEGVGFRVYDLGTLKEVWAFRIIPVRSAQKLAKIAIRFPEFLE